MSKKNVVSVVWALVVILAFVYAGIQLTKDRVLSSTDMVFKTGRAILVDADSVTFQAASDEFFMLRKVSGEIIAGVPKEKPLGWSGSRYFTYGPQPIAGGEWLFPVGKASVKITSENPVTVRLTLQHPDEVWSGLLIFAACLWAIGWLIFI